MLIPLTIMSDLFARASTVVYPPFSTPHPLFDVWILPIFQDMPLILRLEGLFVKIFDREDWTNSLPLHECKQEHWSNIWQNESNVINFFIRVEPLWAESEAIRKFTLEMECSCIFNQFYCDNSCTMLLTWPNLKCVYLECRQQSGTRKRNII